MPSLNKLIGTKIALSFKLGERMTWVKLHAVEAGGIWVESQPLTNMILQLSDSPAAPKTAVFFLPFSTIGSVASSLDEMSLGEKAFGV